MWWSSRGGSLGRSVNRTIITYYTTPLLRSGYNCWRRRSSCVHLPPAQHHRRRRHPQQQEQQQRCCSYSSACTAAITTTSISVRHMIYSAARAAGHYHTTARPAAAAHRAGIPPTGCGIPTRRPASSLHKLLPSRRCRVCLGGPIAGPYYDGHRLPKALRDALWCKWTASRKAYPLCSCMLASQISSWLISAGSDFSRAVSCSG